jgi:hypothetical protein
MVLVMYSVEEQGLGCVKNTSVSNKQSDWYLVTLYRLRSLWLVEIKYIYRITEQMGEADRKITFH